MSDNANGEMARAEPGARLPAKRNGGSRRPWLLPSIVAAAALLLLLRRRRGRKTWWEDFADAGGPQTPRRPDDD